MWSTKGNANKKAKERENEEREKQGRRDGGKGGIAPVMTATNPEPTIKKMSHRRLPLFLSGEGGGAAEKTPPAVRRHPHTSPSLPTLRPNTHLHPSKSATHLGPPLRGQGRAERGRVGRGGTGWRGRRTPATHPPWDATSYLRRTFSPEFLFLAHQTRSRDTREGKAQGKNSKYPPENTPETFLSKLTISSLFN